MNLLAAGGTAVTGALLATRAGWLRPSAAWAAGLIAFAHLAGAGWVGGLLLGMFVVSGSVLTRRFAPHGALAVRRDAGQVLANGGVAALASLIVRFAPVAGWPLLVGALAAAQADTWATEIGRTSRRLPRDLWTGRVVTVGTSGGVTWRGTAAGIAGALLLGAAAWPALGWRVAAAGMAGGVLGQLVDSAVGGPLQARYLCTVCGTVVETRQHCRARAPRTTGLRWFGNSAVNAVGTLSGGLASLLLSGWPFS